MKKKLFVVVVAVFTTLTLIACSGNAASNEELIKVGIINNDPNESGYRTTNDADPQSV